MDWLSIVKALLQLLPSILQAINAIEQSTQGTGQGSVKKAVVMTTVNEAPPEVQSAVSALVDNIVAVKNAAGEFKK